MKLTLNIYSKERNAETGKKEIAKTYTTDEYDLMYGTVEDILVLFDNVNVNDTTQVMTVIRKFMNQLNPLLKDVFYGLTDEEMKNIKVKELVPVIVNIIKLAMSEFGDGSKNVQRG